MNTKSLPKIALGAWAWGNDGTFGHQLTKEDLRPVFDTAMDNGLYLWDTAFAYGMGYRKRNTSYHRCDEGQPGGRRCKGSRNYPF